MADKNCPQCGETVAESKAFCPSCGHAFVDEQQRTDASAYEKADHTMQMGQTMYNDMLSDMGLNVKQPAPEKRVEVLRPAAGNVQVLQPIAPAPTPTPAEPSIHQEPEKKSNAKIWIITAVVAAALLLILIAFVVLVGLYLYFRAGKL